MFFKGLASKKFAATMAGSMMALSLAGCATRSVTDSGIVTSGMNYGPFGTTRQSSYDPRIGNAYDIQVLRSNPNGDVARVGDAAACFALQDKENADVTARRLQEADRIDTAASRAQGVPANDLSRRCNQQQQQPRPAGM